MRGRGRSSDQIFSAFCTVIKINSAIEDWIYFDPVRFTVPVDVFIQNTEFG